MRYKLRSSLHGNQKTNVKNKPRKNHLKSKVGNKSDNGKLIFQERNEYEKQNPNFEADGDGVKSGTTSEETFPLKEEIGETLIDVEIEGNSTLQTDPLDPEDEIKIDYMVVDSENLDKETKIIYPNTSSTEEETSSQNNSWNNLPCMKVRNFAHLTDPRSEDQSGQTHGRTDSTDHPTEERISLATRVITYLGAVSFVEDTASSNISANIDGRAYLEDKEPAFSFLLVLTKSECPCVLKVEATSSGYVVTKEETKVKQGVQDREKILSEAGSEDRCEKETSLESNQNQDKAIHRLKEVNKVFDDNLRGKPYKRKPKRKQKDLPTANPNSLLSSQEITSGQHLSQDKGLYSCHNSNEEGLSLTTPEKEVPNEGHQTVASRVESCNELDDGQNDYSFNLSDDDNVEKTLTLKKQLKPGVKRKRQSFWCVFCKKLVYHNYSRHLRRKHKEEDQIQKILELDKSNSSDSNKEKQKLINKLRNEGTRYYNRQILSESGSKEDILSKLICKNTPKDKKYLMNKVICKYCQNVYSRKTFSRHMYKCDLFKSASSENYLLSKKQSIIKICGQQLYPPIDGASQEFKDKILPHINKDKFVLEALKDKLIMSIVSRFFEIHKEERYRHSISQKIRKGGKLLLNVKNKDCTIKKMKNCFHPSKYNLVADTVLEMCTFNRKNCKKNESLERILLWVINKAASKLLEDIMIDEESSEDVRLSSKKDINKFLILFHRKMKAFKTKSNGQLSERNQTYLQKASFHQKENYPISPTNLQTLSSKDQIPKFRSNPDKSPCDEPLSSDISRAVFEIIPNDVSSVLEGTATVVTIASADSSNIKSIEPKLQMGSVEKAKLECSKVATYTEESVESSLSVQQLSSMEVPFGLANNDGHPVDCFGIESHGSMVKGSRKETNDRTELKESLDPEKSCSQVNRNDDVQLETLRNSDSSVKIGQGSKSCELGPDMFDSNDQNNAEEISSMLNNQVDIVHNSNTGKTVEDIDMSFIINESEALQSREDYNEKITESDSNKNVETYNSQSTNNVEMLETNILGDLVDNLIHSTSNSEPPFEQNTDQILETINSSVDLVEYNKTQPTNVNVGKEYKLNEKHLQKENSSGTTDSGSNLDIIKEMEGFKNSEKQMVITNKIMGEHYCIFCKYLIRNFRRHVLQNHKEEKEIVRYFKLFREDKENTHQERSRILEDLCNEGDRIYVEIITENPSMEYVLTSGLPEKQSPAKRKPSQDKFQMCKKCKSLLSQEEYPNHVCVQDEHQSETSDEEDYDKWIPKCKVAKVSHSKKKSKQKTGKDNESPSTIRKRWTDEERSIVINEFKDFITKGTNPGTNRCRDLILKHKCLSGRTNLQLNTMIDNINRGKLKLPEEFQYLKIKH